MDSTLRAMGMRIVVSLRETRSEVATRKRPVESLGMKSVEILWSQATNPQVPNSSNSSVWFART
jgi:hypothetical protein